MTIKAGPRFGVVGLVLAAGLLLAPPVAARWTPHLGLPRR